MTCCACAGLKVNDGNYLVDYCYIGKINFKFIGDSMRNSFVNRLIPAVSGLIFFVLLLPAVWSVSDSGTVLFSGSVQAQTPGTVGLNSANLSSLRSEDISDEQLKAFIERARRSGFTESQALNLARERGMSPTEVQELRERVRRLERFGTSDDPDAEDFDRTDEVMEDDFSGSFAREYARRSPLRMEDDPLVMRLAWMLESEVARTFGSEVFRRGGAAFEPSLFAPTPATYVLGAGDELVVDVWGESTDVYRLQVSREGTVTINNLGPVFVHGLTLEQAEARLLQQLKTLHAGMRSDDNPTTFARVSLARLRSIQVSVIGEVTQPGDYTLSSMATVFNALYRAGGPNHRGSYRSIQVFRGSRMVGELDLYDFLVNGDQSGNIRLNDQDVIRVQPLAKRVELEGEVRRNGYFHLKSGETLSDLIRFSGNFTGNAYTRHVRIHRNTPVERIIITVQSEQFDSFEMQDGDKLIVDRILQRFANRVVVNGAVWRPGEFELSAGFTLSQLITEAGGLRPDAYLTRGIINRLRDDFSLEILAFDVRQVMENPLRYDILLRPDDEVLVQSIFDMREEFTVRVFGAVRRQGTFEFRENMTLKDVVFLAEGFLESASSSRIEVSRRINLPAGQTYRGSVLAETFIFDVERDLSLSDQNAAFVLEPFDQIFVRNRPDYQAQMNVAVEGEVMYPGVYTISTRNERISDIIKRTGGLTDEAFVPGASLTRRLRRTQVTYDFLDGEEEEIERLIGDQLESRIGIDLRAILNNPGSPEDLFVRAGDVLRIPGQEQTVRVSGAVMQGVEIRFQRGENLRYYINRAGGYSESARRRSAYVVYANGDVNRRRTYVWGLFASSPEIQPGTEIIIPEKPQSERMSSAELIAVSTAVVSMASTLVIMIERLAR
jgi:protein involved in polysaccharide export with SLBB domain